MAFNNRTVDVRADGDALAREPDNGWAIEADDLAKTYGSVAALDGVSFRVPAGTVFALLGPNGAGKSTTVKILTTLTRPDAGTATVAGTDVLRHAPGVRNRIGVVAQKAGADLSATGRENLVLQGQLYGLRGRSLAARVDELLDRFGLTEAAGRQTGTYSGGMLRKLDVAMGLVHRPSVLFLDEPTNGLDPEARAMMWAEITQLTQHGLTVLLTTHYMEEADRLADRLAIIDRGRIVVEGTPEALKGQLRGDAVLVEVRDFAATEPARIAVSRLPGVTEVLVEGREIRARVDHGASAVPAVLSALDTAGLPVASVTVSRPSLDDVYLRHAGRSFSVNSPAEREGAAA